MSNYSKFLDDLNDFYKRRRTSGDKETISNDLALAAIRDKWISENRLKELVGFIHENWDSGNCDEFMKPLEIILIETGQSDLFKSLWTKIIRCRLSKLWDSVSDLNQRIPAINLQEISSIDVSDFNMFSKESYKDKQKVLAFHRAFSLAGLQKMKEGLSTLEMHDDVCQIENITKEVSLLRRTNFKLS
jgi:hypothetical protein